MNTNVMDIFKQVIEKADNDNPSDLMPMLPLFLNEIVTFAGVEKTTRRRYFFIEIEDGPWDEDLMRALPKWNGLIIKMEYHNTFGPLKERYFLEFMQADSETGDLFETIMQNIFDHILLKTDDEPLFTVIYKVLEKWRSFFKRGGYKKLSVEQERGLFGELWFMSRYMKSNTDHPPLLLKGWGGPLSDRIDFKANGWGIEIKTSVDRLDRKIRISNEDQLKISDAIPNICLYVCFLEISHTFGTTLQEMVEELRKGFSSFSPQLLLKFNDSLVQSGYQDNEYTETMFNIVREETYEVKGSFPTLSKAMLPIGISHVSYSIDLSHCNEYKMETEKIFTLI